jgi:hypothetical protein
MLPMLALIALCFVLSSQAARVVAFESPVRKLLHDISEARKWAWRNADAPTRERIVRQECACRVIGRVAVAGTLLTAAFATASPVLAIACTVAAWRAVKPTKREMRDACSYRSTGARDEPTWSW